MLEWIILSLVGAGSIPLAIFMYVVIRSRQLEREVEVMIAEYRSRLNGSNRFLFDEQLMRQVFPEYSEYLIHKVWGRLVVSKAIDRDPMDGSWCIK